MNKSKLSSAFLVGHEKIDADHVELVHILNAMVDVCKVQNSTICLEEWQKFYDRLRIHFYEEEEIMSKFGYSDEEHIKDHKEILDHVKSLGEKCEEQNNWEDCIHEIERDLLVQILRHDLKFAEYLVSTGYQKL
ncbi:MAG: hemerythrin family protein [Emcibacter sp.]|nr:hemerythrin family protein [Emcibacter sp.]